MKQQTICISNECKAYSKCGLVKEMYAANDNVFVFYRLFGDKQPQIDLISVHSIKRLHLCH